MSEEDGQATDTHADDQDDAALVAEVEELTKNPVEAQGDKVKNALIATKRELRAANRKVKELEPIAAGATDLHTRLSAAQPMIDALVNSPKLRAEALRITQGGTRTTPEGTDQPSADEDPDAAEFAELNNFYLPDGMTLDVARGKRGLALLDRRSGRQTDERIRPLAGITLNAKANANLTEAINAVDDDGTPMATRESISEIAKSLPQHLLADQAVVDLILNSAIGLDKRKKRTPKPVEEPLYLERQGGGRTRGTALGSDERDFLQKTGISEKDYRESASRLETGVASRRGIVLE